MLPQPPLKRLMLLLLSLLLLLQPLLLPLPLMQQWAPDRQRTPPAPLLLLPMHQLAAVAKRTWTVAMRTWMLQTRLKPSDPQSKPEVGRRVPRSRTKITSGFFGPNTSSRSVMEQEPAQRRDSERRLAKTIRDIAWLVAESFSRAAVSLTACCRALRDDELVSEQLDRTLGGRLQRAAFLGDLLSIRTILSRGANVDGNVDIWRQPQRFCGCTPLALAVAGGHVTAARVLLAAGASTPLVFKNSSGIVDAPVSTPTDPIAFDDLVAELCAHPGVGSCDAVLIGVRLRVPRVVVKYVGGDSDKVHHVHALATTPEEGDDYGDFVDPSRQREDLLRELVATRADDASADRKGRLLQIFRWLGRHLEDFLFDDLGVSWKAIADVNDIELLRERACRGEELSLVLFAACSCGDGDLVEQMLAEDGRIDKWGDEEHVILYAPRDARSEYYAIWQGTGPSFLRAALMGHVCIVHSLLRWVRKHSDRSSDVSRATRLLAAVYVGLHDEARIILEEGRFGGQTHNLRVNDAIAEDTPGSEESHGWLAVACQRADVEMVTLLLRAGADPNYGGPIMGGGWSLRGFGAPLLLASAVGRGGALETERRESIVRALIEAGARLPGKSWGGRGGSAKRQRMAVGGA